MENGRKARAVSVTVSKSTSMPRTEIPLSGFSGAKILLIREDYGAPFVRKISADPAGNSRLQLQAAKQKLTMGLLDGAATTPHVLDEGEVDGLYYFDMEYIRGMDGISFLRTATLEEVNDFVARLCDSLKRFSQLQDPSTNLSPQARMQRKCEDVLATIPSAQTRSLRLVNELLSRTQEIILPSHVPITACHGDMTLENIVVTKAGGIVFIDLLDSFVDHCLADVAKLDQDLRGGWYTRKSSPLPISLVQHIRRRLSLLAFELHPDVAHMAPLLVCVHFARILPYARHEAEREFILDRLDYLLRSLRPDGSAKEGIPE